MGSGPLTAGLTTFDGNGAYASSTVGWVANERLQVFAQCVDAAKLSGSTLSSVTVRDTRPGWRYRHRTVSCPTGTWAYGGGSFLSTPTGPSRQSLYTYESAPNASTWRYSGGGCLNGNSAVYGTHCLPRPRLCDIAVVTATNLSHMDGDLLATARCPAGSFAFTGGAWFHGTDSFTPRYVGHLKRSIMAADDGGWTAFGNVYGPGRLTAKVLCTNRLG